MSRQAFYLKSNFLVALCVTACVFLVEPKERHVSTYQIEENEEAGLVLSCSDFSFGSENLPRSLQSLKSPFNGFHKGLCFSFVEKVESISTKVSFRYLSVKELFQGREDYLFLHLRKLLI